VIEKYEETPKLLRIEALMNVERDSQKKILIGHKGEMLKKIGTEARKELEGILGSKIYLGLFVKVCAGLAGKSPEGARTRLALPTGRACGRAGIQRIGRACDLLIASSSRSIAEVQIMLRN